PPARSGVLGRRPDRRRRPRGRQDRRPDLHPPGHRRPVPRPGPLRRPFLPRRPRPAPGLARRPRPAALLPRHRRLPQGPAPAPPRPGRAGAAAARRQAGAPAAWLWHGRRVVLVDGTCASMPDTPANQAAYPQHGGQEPGGGFPIARLVVLLSLATGAVLDAAV